MPMIITSRTRQRQPVGQVEINWAHPLLRDADIVFDGARPLVNRTKFSTQGTGALAQRQTSKGIGAEVSASSAARLSYLVPQPSATSPWTVAAIVTPLVLASGGEAGNGVTLIGMVDDTISLDRGIYLVPGTFAWRGYLYDGASKSADSSRSAAVGRTDTVIVGYNGSQVTVSVDGGYQAATAVSNAGYAAYNVNRRFSVGAAAGTACTNGSTFAVSLVVRAQRYWSAAEQAEFVRNPWQIFAPRRRPVVFFGPSAGAGTTVAVPLGAVSVAGYAPTVTATANQTISVPVGAVSLAGYAPTISTSASQTIAVPAGAVTLAGYAPTVTATANQVIAAPAGAVSLTGYAPSVFTTAVTTIAVPAGAVSLAGFAPSVSYTTHAYIDVPKGAVTLTGYAPTVTGGESSIWTPVTTDSAVWSAQNVSAATWTLQ